MKQNPKTPLMLGISAALLTALCTIDALGELSLTNIPPLSTDTSNEGRAITPDGKYVGGRSGTGNGFFYDAANAYVAQPLAGSYAATITGIAYRTDTNQVPAMVQVVLDGNNAGYHGQFATSDGGLTWAVKRRDNTTSPPYTLSGWPSPPANSLAGALDSDVWFNIFRSGDRNNLYTCRGSNLWDGVTAAGVIHIGKGLSSDTGDVYGVTPNGRIVGYRTSGGVKWNVLYDYPNSSGTQWRFNGLAGTPEGEAWSISHDGTCIFGRSPILSGDTTTYGYKTIVTPTPPNTQLSVNQLPNFSDTGGSVSLAVPYGCTPDGKYAVGMNYRGSETAVLWDTSSADPATWTVTDLYGLAAANGVADIFIRLNRAYSAGTNDAGDPVITGYGWDGFSTRAFLMTVPRWIAAIGFPGHQTVVHDSDVTFTVKTNGTDALSFQWYKDGSPLPGQTSTSISFTGVTCPGGQAGDYQVVVNNTAISAVVTGMVARLTVLDPQILVQPSHQTNVLGTTATFSVSATGSAPLSFKWQRDGFDLFDGPTGYGSTLAGTTTDTLTILNAQLTDAGQYTVVVSVSGACQTTSATRTLTVLGPPSITSIVSDTVGGYMLSFDGPINQTYKVLYSTDVALPPVMWTVLATGTFPGVEVIYQDVTPMDAQRFYMIESP